jgi:hypothetical protein
MSVLSIKTNIGKSLVIFRLPLVTNWRPKTNFNCDLFDVSLWPCHLHERIFERKKTNYGNSNILPCKNIIFKIKSFKRNQIPSRYHNSTTNPKFKHKPKYHLSKILE